MSKLIIQFAMCAQQRQPNTCHVLHALVRVRIFPFVIPASCFFPLPCRNPTLKSSRRLMPMFHIAYCRAIGGKVSLEFCCVTVVMVCLFFFTFKLDGWENIYATQKKAKENKRKEKEMCSKHKDHRHRCLPSQKRQSSPPSGCNLTSQTAVSQIYGVLFVRHPHMHFLHVICRHAAWKILLPLTALRLLHTAFCKLWGRKKESARWQ